MFHNDCGKCKREVKDLGLGCERCNDWYHIKCVGVSEYALEYLSDSGLLWLCGSCEPVVRNLIINSLNGPRPEAQGELAGASNSLNRVSKNKKKSSSPAQALQVVQNSSKAKVENNNKTHYSAENSNKWKTVKAKGNNNKSKQSLDKVPVVPIKIANKFILLDNVQSNNINCEYTIVGDSIIKQQDIMFCNKVKKPRKRLCVPGGKIEHINKVISNLKENNGQVIVNVGINDLVLKPKNRFAKFEINRNSEQIFAEYKTLINILKGRNSKDVVVGVLPRLDANWELENRIVAMNKRVKALCKSVGIGFIDMYDSMRKCNALYKEDGLHLNFQGSQVYCGLLEQGLSELGFQIDR